MSIMNSLGKWANVRRNSLHELFREGVIVSTDPRCKELIFDTIAAKIMRIIPWPSQLVSNDKTLTVRVFRNGQLLTTEELPIERSTKYGEELNNIEVECLWEDGVRKKVLCSSRPLYDSAGEIVGAACTIEDITDRRRFEEELIQREKQYRTIVENQSDLVCRSLPDTTVIYANPAYCRAIGRDTGAVIGKRWLDLVSPTVRQFLHKGWEKFCRDTPVRETKEIIPLITADGAHRYIEWVNCPIAEDRGAVVEILSVGRDRTTEKRLEEERRHKETEYRKIVNSLDCHIFLLDEGGNIEIVNDFAKKFFWNRLGNLLGKPMIGAVIADGGPSAQSLSRVIDGVDPSNETQFTEEYGQSNGDNTWIQWSFRRYGASGFLCVGYDITKQHQAEEAMKNRYLLRYLTFLFNKVLRDEISSREFADTVKSFGAFAAKSLLIIIQIHGVIDNKPHLMQESEVQHYQPIVDSLIIEISHMTKSIAWESPAGIAVIIPLPQQGKTPIPEKGMEIVEKIFSLARRVFPNKQVSVGTATTKRLDIISAYRQAEFALRAGPVNNRDTVVHRWEGLGILQLMSTCCDSDLSRTYVQAELGALLEYDKRRASSLVETLGAILTSDSTASAARRLYVHEKTVLFRKRKIEKILGTSIDKMDNRLNLLAAIKLLSIMKSENMELPR